MKNNFECPGEKLVEMVGVLTPKYFKSLSVEPGLDNAERLISGHYPDAVVYEVTELYGRLLIAYGKVHRLAFELYKFGDSLEEIMANLRLHVHGCRRCDWEYSEMVDGKLEEQLSKLRERSPDFARSLKMNQIIQMRERIDKKYLNLASFFKK